MLSVIAGAAPFLIHDYSLTLGQISEIMGLVLLGGVVAKIILICNDYFGRKKLIYINLIIYIIGILVFTNASGYGGLWIGRFLQGGALIMASVVFTVYLSEIAPSSKRGVIITSFQLAWTAGMLIANLVNLKLAASGDWQLMFNVVLIIPIILLIFAPFLPESPRWLVLKGRLEEATNILKSINRSMTSSALEKESSQLLGGVKVDWHKSFPLIFKYKKAIFIVIAIFTLTQLCGINAMMQAGALILNQCGVKSTFMAIFGTTLLAAVNFVMTLGTIALVDKIGRRKLIKIGTCGFFITMFFLAICIGVLPKSPTTGWLTLICMMIAIGFLAFGPNGVIYVILAEILPTPVRTIGLIIGGIASVVVGYFFVSEFLIIGGSFGYTFLFSLMGSFALIYFLFAIFILPETAGKTLEEIEINITKKP